MNIIGFHELNVTLVLRLGIVMVLGYEVVLHILVFFIFGDKNFLKTG